MNSSVIFNNIVQTKYRFAYCVCEIMFKKNMAIPLRVLLWWL